MMAAVRRAWWVAGLVFALATPAVLRGQRPSGPPAPGTFVVPSGGPHGRIGVIVKTGTAAATDSIGAWVEAVTPGGPAAKAGLKSGDIITKFNGTSLAGVRPQDEDGSGPGRKLVALAHALQPGDTAPVEYRRGADMRKTKLVAEDVMGWMAVDPVPVLEPAGPGMAFPREQSFGFCFGDPWCDVELVTLTPDLGEYFGAKDGILVVKASADTSLPLKSGDVLLSIGGRKPTSPSHAMRIIASYDAGETVAIEVMRKQKRVHIAWHVPRAGEHMRRFMHFRRSPGDTDPGPPRN
jgi:membrane-associated protease RseP (regulator of RpoE activity)